MLPPYVNRLPLDPAACGFANCDAVIREDIELGLGDGVVLPPSSSRPETGLYLAAVLNVDVAMWADSVGLELGELDYSHPGVGDRVRAVAAARD